MKKAKLRIERDLPQRHKDSERTFENFDVFCGSDIIERILRRSIIDFKEKEISLRYKGSERTFEIIRNYA